MRGLPGAVRDVPADTWWPALQRRYTLLACLESLRDPNLWSTCAPPMPWCDTDEFHALRAQLTAQKGVR
ncbi:hypothetical protein IU501_35370 [Nocardia otitidiscaviarum]|uniref:hypothetical protein n=1 Tax=Nocardia otitidiscaviarum TaxID=1823 RepID=UPI001892D503|nr:hypothetical protein [Nocardia otitidiscaviarum]MBF6138255.1 hypothetical protein [Nocardia otitidiscaviarum]